MPDLPLIPGTLALDCYPASAQAFYNEMFALGHAVMPALGGLLVQDAVPDPIYQTNPPWGWVPTSGGVARYPGYVFIWHVALGHWVARHAVEASDIKRYPAFYADTLANFITYLQTYDGGDVNAPGVASGPMWEVDTQFAGSVPVGVGTIPGSSPAAAIAKGGDTQDSLGQAGEYKHVLATAEGGVGDHVHPIGNADPGTGDIGLAYKVPAATTPSYTAFGVTGGGPIGLPVTQANLISLPANDGAGQTTVAGHNTMQPYVGVFFLKRTGRVWIVAA